jgi:hypothetical protein
MENSLTEKSTEHRLQFYKNILSRYAIGEYLIGKDFDAVLNLLKQHPNAEEKIGVGIKDLLVDDSGYGRYSGKCFHLIRQDGTKENFSYLKCLGHKCNFYNKDKPAENKRKPEPEIIRTTPKPVKVVIASKPIPKISGSDKGVAKATAKAAKITLVLTLPVSPKLTALDKNKPSSR